MNNLKTLLLDTRLNASQLASLAYPTQKRATAASTLFKLVHGPNPPPPLLLKELRKLSQEIARSLSSQEAMLRFCQDKRLSKVAISRQVWPEHNDDSASALLYNRRKNGVILGSERHRLVASLQKLAADIDACLKAPE